MMRLIGVLAAILVVVGGAISAQAQGTGGPASRPERKLTKAPKLIKKVEAVYPREARDKRVEGTVKLKLTIDRRGKVTKAQVLEDPGSGLAAAAQRAVLQYTFEPAEIDNKPASVVLNFSLTFSLPEQPSRFEGKVLDATSGKGIAKAAITITFKGELPRGQTKAPSVTGVTDKKGKFGFYDVPAGPWAVRLQIDKYRSFETTITLVPGKTSEAEYKIEAEPENFYGRVREAGTRKYLAGITVEIFDGLTNKLVDRGFTDAQGRFGFRGLKPGGYTVRIDGDGYLGVGHGETINANEELETTYYIEAEFYDEYAVKTTAKRERREVNRRTLKLEEVRRIPGTNGDVVRVIQNLPGVARPRFLGGQIIVRGAAPQDTQIFLEGDPIPIVFHFLGGPAIINSEMIASIDFLPGNFSARYGRATAGIIDLQARSPKTDGFHGFAEVDLLDSTLLLEGPITEDLSFAVSGRRSYIDAVLPLVIPEGTFDAFVVPVYYDYQGWLTYRGFKDSKIELFLYGSNDNLEVVSESADDPDFQGLDFNTGFHRGQLRWEWRPDGPIQNDFMASIGVNTLTLDLLGTISADLTYFQSVVRDDLTLTIADNLKVRMGADFLLGNGSGGVSFVQQVPLVGEDGEQVDLGIKFQEPLMSLAYYVEASYKPIESVELVPGLRLDYFGAIRRLSPAPRLTARVKVAEPVTLKGGVGLFTQAPQPTLTAQALGGNPNLLPEKAWQYAVGAEWTPLEHIEVDATLFYRDAFDIAADSDQLTVGGIGADPERELYASSGDGRAFGLELLLRWYPYKRFFGWIAYTLSRSERRANTLEELAIYEFDQTHIFTVIAGYNFPYGIDVSARMRLVTGYPFTPVLGSVFDAGRQSYQRVDGAPFSARESTFHQLDLRIDKKWIFQSWRLGAFLDIINIYNQGNQEGVAYNYDFTEQGIITGLPILPTLGVNARW